MLWAVQRVRGWMGNMDAIDARDLGNENYARALFDRQRADVARQRAEYAAVLVFVGALIARDAAEIEALEAGICQ